MTSLAQQLVHNEAVRLKFLNGGRPNMESDIRKVLQSDEDVRKQCDMMTELIFALVAHIQKLHKTGQVECAGFAGTVDVLDSTSDNVDCPYAGSDISESETLDMADRRRGLAELLTPAFLELLHEGLTPAYFKLQRIHEYARLALNC